MKKIKFYIVTYNRKNDLHNTLVSLYNTDINNHNVEVFIVNNHTNFEINDEFKSKVTVLHNTMRPDFSTGHLSRNYNEILIHGFKDLNSPDCNILIHSHDDNIFDENLFSGLIKHHETYSFISFSQGCGLCSYLPEAVKNIGMWDERFCTIGYHEGDYFLRAIKYNREKSSINDWGAAHREINPIEHHLASKLENTSENGAHRNSIANYSVCRQLFELKWGGFRDVEWPRNEYFEVPNPGIATYVMYPYFERNLNNVDSHYFRGIDFNGHPYMR